MINFIKILIADGSIIFYGMAIVILVLIAEYAHILYGLFADYRQYKDLLRHRRFW